MNEQKKTEWTSQSALAKVEEVRAKLDAIGLPAERELGSQCDREVDAWARERYAEAVAQYDEFEKGWQNADMMAALLLDAIDMAMSVARDAAGGWKDWPKEPLANVGPAAKRELAEPESEGGKKYAALEALADESEDVLMEIRGVNLAKWSPEKLQVHLGEGGHDPRKVCVYGAAGREMYWWLSEVVRLHLGDVGWLRSSHGAGWIQDAMEVIDLAKDVAENIRRREHEVGSLAVAVAGGERLDEVPPVPWWASIYAEMQPAEWKETRMEKLVRLGKELEELRRKYLAMPEWARMDHTIEI